MGTKYTAFAPLLPVEDVAWTVYDLPAVIRATRGRLPSALGFEEDLGKVGEVDLLLG